MIGAHAAEPAAMPQPLPWRPAARAFSPRSAALAGASGTVGARDSRSRRTDLLALPDRIAVLLRGRALAPAPAAMAGRSWPG
jgi:hypothetical protein